MPYCAIAGCNTGNARIPDANHFQCFNLPKSEDIKEKWLEKIKINRSDFAPSSHTVICEKHFRRYDFISDTQNLDRRGKTKKKKKLKLKAIPSLYMSGDLADETWNYSDNIGEDQYQSDDNEGNLGWKNITIGSLGSWVLGFPTGIFGGSLGYPWGLL